MNIKHLVLRSALVACLVLPACKDDTTDSAGPQATSSDDAQIRTDQAALRQVIAKMEQDVMIFNAISCELPCAEGELTGEQQEVILRLGGNFMVGLLSGPENPDIPGDERFRNYRAFKILMQRLQDAGVTERPESYAAWFDTLSITERESVAQTFLTIINVYAAASDLPPPFRQINDAGAGRLEGTSNPLIHQYRQPIAFLCAGGAALWAWGGTAAAASTATVGGAVTATVASTVILGAGGLAYTYINGEEHVAKPSRKFECTQWVHDGWFDFGDEVCCGYRCVYESVWVPVSDPRPQEELFQCEEGATVPGDPNGDDIEDCDPENLILPRMDMAMPDMAMPDMEMPDMDTPSTDIGAERRDGGVEADATMRQ